MDRAMTVDPRVEAGVRAVLELDSAWPNRIPVEIAVGAVLAAADAVEGDRTWTAGTPNREDVPLGPDDPRHEDRPRVEPYAEYMRREHGCP